MKKKIITFGILVLTFFLAIDTVSAQLTTNPAKKGEDMTSEYVNNMGTISVTGVDSGDLFSAYKILDVYYNTTSNEVTYQFTDTFKDFLQTTEDKQELSVDQYMALTSGDILSGSTQTDSTLDQLASLYATYIKENSKEGVALTTQETNASGSVEAGSYLILPTKAKRVYAVMVGNVEPKAQGEEWVIENASIVAKVSDVGIKKYVGDKGTLEKAYRVGEEFTYLIEATVPTYPTNATNKTYTIKDTMSSGLTFSGLDSIEVSDGGTKLTNDHGQLKDSLENIVGTATEDGGVLTIVFNVDYIKTNSLEIKYKAKLNEHATFGTSGNKNSALLTYSVDPYGEKEQSTKEIQADDVTVKTYRLKILKHKKGDKQTTLKGATFEIYTDEDLRNKVGEVTTEESGEASVGLADGKYYLKETHAPSGYRLEKNKIEVSVQASDTETLLEIPNDPASLLPFTGGIGTIIYTGVGITIVLLATYGIVKSRRKEL